jgi:hypothetical protein
VEPSLVVRQANYNSAHDVVLVVLLLRDHYKFVVAVHMHVVVFVANV